MYAKIVDGAVVTYPYTDNLLKADHPNTSFPDTMTDAMLQTYGMYSVTQSDLPDHDGLISYASETTPTLVDGAWTQTWQVHDYELEIQQRNVRQERDKLLFETDYLALSDTTLSSEMAAYRQALRDVPAQSGFPASVTWPIRP
tara:strand:+ start:2028 stop:2456 length:429 start_codon:yes stop_codon:yes gene_type:complete